MFKKIGNLFLVKPHQLSQEEISFYKDLNFSNFLFFENHFAEDFSFYISRIKEKLSFKLLAVDQEGGKVCRIKGDFASPLEIGKKYMEKGEKVVIDWAREIIKVLKKYSLNLNLAPCVDLYGEKAPEFIKGRTFGDDPHLVKKLAYLFINEHQKSKIFTCLKHFPGLKNVEIDPHKDLPFKENIDEKSLIPYQYLIEKIEPPFIMTTHLVIKEIDPQPVTFSSKIIEILRKKLDYKGIIISDDLLMGALKEWEFEEKIILALVSGHNMLIYSGDFSNLMKSLEEIKTEIEKSKIVREKVKESLYLIDKIL